MSPHHAAAKVGLPDEHEDGFAIVGPEHNPGGAQERSQDLHQTWVQLVHLVKEEEGAAAGCEVPLDPALKILLQGRGRTLKAPGGAPLTSDFFPREELSPSQARMVSQRELTNPFMGLVAKLWPGGVRDLFKLTHTASQQAERDSIPGLTSACSELLL